MNSANLVIGDEESPQTQTSRGLINNSKSTINLSKLVNHPLLDQLSVEQKALLQERLREVDADDNARLDSDEVIEAFINYSLDLKAAEAEKKKATKKELKAKKSLKVSLAVGLVLLVLLAVQFAGNSAIVKNNQPVAIEGTDHLVTKDGNQVKVVSTANKIKAFDFEEEDSRRRRLQQQLNTFCHTVNNTVAESYGGARRLEDEGSAAATNPPQVSLGCFDNASVNAIEDSAGGTIQVQTSGGFQTLAVHSWRKDANSGVIYVNEDHEDAFALYPSSDCQASSDANGEGDGVRRLQLQNVYNLCIIRSRLHSYYDCLSGMHSAAMATLCSNVGGGVKSPFECWTRHCFDTRLSQDYVRVIGDDFEGGFC